MILGPTASGKTGLAIQMAKEKNALVISADSRQVYAGMNIGTAKAKEAWKSRAHEVVEADVVEGVPHYLFNVREPNAPYTLADWQRDALAVVEANQHKEIVVAGGTMLYLDSLMSGYTIPEVAPDEALRAELEKKKVEELYRELTEKDSGAKNFIEPHHKQRIIRALEVVHATGKKFSELRQKTKSPYEFKVIGLFSGWEKLNENIAQRVEEMVKEGLIEETESLMERYSPTLPLLNTINYKQAKMVIARAKTLSEAKEEMVRASVRYAHRQMSWWKRNEKIDWQVK